MNYDTDGNLAALRQYEREQDALYEADEAFEELLGELSDELFEAYFEGNTGVVDEVNDAFTLTEFEGELEEICREYFNRPMKMHDEYREFIGRVCDAIAKRCDDLYDVEGYRREFKL